MAKQPIVQTDDVDEGAEISDVELSEPVEFWATKQKELVTSVVDYNLSTLVDLISESVIDLDPKYQRRLRWDTKRQSKLIESFLMNVPVPPVYLNEDDYGRYSVIDGKQRLTAIAQFITNNYALEGLKLFSDINGQKFNELPAKLRNILRTRPTVRAVIILRQSDKDIKYEVFQRLNTGGAHLNAQEIRNNAFHGSLNALIMELSDSKKMHAALGIKNKHKSAVYQQMRDAELVLRYFTFRQTWGTFSGGMKRAMDSYMDENRNPGKESLGTLRHEFVSTIDCVTGILGEHAFQRWMPERNEWRRHVLAALYDAQMFAFQDFELEQLLPKREEFVESFKQLFELDSFRVSIDAATNTPSLFKDRVRSIRNLLNEIVSSG